jgi:hypothetical protein
MVGKYSLREKAKQHIRKNEEEHAVSKDVLSIGKGAILYAVVSVCIGFLIFLYVYKDPISGPGFVSDGNTSGTTGNPADPSWGPRKKVQHQWFEAFRKVLNDSKFERGEYLLKLVDGRVAVGTPRPEPEWVEFLETPVQKDWVMAVIPTALTDVNIGENWYQQVHARYSGMVTVHNVRTYLMVLKDHQNYSDLSKASIVAHELSHVDDMINSLGGAPVDQLATERRARETEIAMITALYGDKLKSLAQKFVPRIKLMAKNNGFDYLAKHGLTSDFLETSNKFFGEPTSDVDSMSKAGNFYYYVVTVAIDEMYEGEASREAAREEFFNTTLRALGYN